ncbi:MAG: PP2C family protein-serine/threonine phosphatase [Candidatus Kapaibacterium sp.]
MQHFPQKRHRSDFIILAIGILSIVVYFWMKPYWPTPSFVSIPPDRTNDQILDSLMHRSGISKDTATITTRPNFNAVLSSGIADSVGTFRAKQYFETYHLPCITKIYYVQKKVQEEVNFRITTGQNITKKNRSAQSQHFLKVELTPEGDIEALEKQVIVETDSLLTDTSRLLQYLMTCLPPAYQSELSVWKPESAERGYSFVTTKKLFPYHLENIHLTALVPSSQEPRRMLIGWEKEYVPRRESTTSGEQFSSFRGGVAVIVVLVLIGFIGVFIAQLRKRAVSIAFTLLASIAVTLYFVSVSLSFSAGLSITALILISVSTFIFVGFLLGGMPLGGILSLALEQFPHKFYSVRRIVDSPWKSYFTGRSIVLSMSITMAGACIFPLSYWMFSAIGYDKPMQTMIFNGAFFSLLQNPFILISAGLLFVPLISFAIGLMPIAVSYRFFTTRRWRWWGAIVGSVLSFALLAGVQGDPTFPVLLQGCLLGLSYLILFYYTDVLGLSVMALVSGILFFLPLSSDYTLIQILYYGIIGVLLLIGMIGFLQSPEKVHEQDYKPEYLYKIEEEKRLRDELTAAQVVQRKLLPSKMPTYPLLDVAATCIPAFEVGGDYYDFFPLDDHHLGILIGDVSGKGMSAAFYITLAKGVIVSQIQQSFSPADVLCKVNKLLYDTMERGKFISLIYGIINTESMEFTYAQAGHNPILHRSSAGATEMLPARGLALGLDSGQVFNHATTDHTVRIGSGESLILYTDGVTEAVNLSGDEFELSGLLRSASKSSADSLGLLQGIVTDVQSFIGKAKQHDDITLVVIKNNTQRQQLTHQSE